MQIDTAVHTKAKYFLAADSFEEMAAWQAAIAGAVQSEDDSLENSSEPELGTSMYPRLSASETAAGAAPTRARRGEMQRADCRYGSECYQQNAAHRTQFAHPGCAISCSLCCRDVIVKIKLCMLTFPRCRYTCCVHQT